MPVDIPSVGVPVSRPILDVFDPNDVNIEAQAYPRPLDPPQEGEIPASSVVADLAATPPSFSMGTAVPELPAIDVSLQNLVRNPVDWLVAPAVNVRIGSDPTQRVEFVIASVVTVVNGGSTQYTLTIGVAGVNPATVASVAATNLFALNVPLFGVEIQLPDSAPGLDPNDVPTAPVIFYGTNFLVVDGTDLTGNAPVANDRALVPSNREGSENIVQQTAAPVTVNITASSVPPVAGSVPNVFV